MKHISVKIFGENQDIFYDPELFHENHAVYEKM